MSEKEKQIGDIANYYGGLSVKFENGKYFWGILNYDSDFGWDEIPKSLYDELIKYENNREKEKNFGKENY